MAATEKVKPNFFLVGAAKSGTTSLAAYLDQHPDVFFCSPKEPNYFAFESDTTPTCTGPMDSDALYERLLKHSVTSAAEYQALFASAEHHRAVGEASVRYLYEPSTAERLAGFNRDARIIVLLRHPVERLLSHYFMNVRMLIEPESLEGALRSETHRLLLGWSWDWHYTRVSRYGEQLQRYFSHFPDHQILVIFTDDLLRRPEHTVATVWEHLDVDPTVAGDFSQRHRVGSAPRSRWIDALFQRGSVANAAARRVGPAFLRRSVAPVMQRLNRGRPPALAADLRRRLDDEFADDLDLLRQLVPGVPW